MSDSQQFGGTGSQAGGRVSCAARLIAFGRRALQAAAGVWRAVRAAGVDAAGVSANGGGTGAQAAGVCGCRLCNPVRVARAAARVRSAAHIQAGVDAAAAQAAADERAVFGRISERVAAHQAARVCHCDNCAVCCGIRTICGECRMCVRCHAHTSGCTGCKGVPPPVSADELDAAATVLDARHRQAAGGPVLSVRHTILSNTFGHFSDEVHAAGERAAAVLAAQAATTAGRQRLRTMYDESRAASYPSERAGRLSGYRVDQSDGHGHDL